MSTRSAIEAWRFLRERGQTGGTVEVPSILSGADADTGPVRFALGSAGEGRILLPIGTSEKVPAIPQTPTLQIIDEIYSFDDKSWRFLDLTCLTAELDAVFGEVADEIVRRIADGNSSLKACLSTLGEFRMLLMPRQSKVGKHEIIGLVGELLLLDRLLDMNPDACDLWRGPLAERHDFRGGKVAAEVKTSGRTANEVMKVTSIDQLLEPASGKLCVVRYTLEETAGGSCSIARLFASAASKSSDPLRLRDLLARMECPDPQAEDWNTVSFDLEEARSYRIDDNFPRIVPRSLADGGLPSGVDAISYSVDLASARSSLLSEEEFVRFLEEMVSCI